MPSTLGRPPVDLQDPFAPDPGSALFDAEELPRGRRPSAAAAARDPEGALRELFGFPGFRPGQREAVEAALAGRDALVVMPTGSGKSLCYQLPALVRDDLTLVVSPLVSLMQDQVESLSRVAPGAVARLDGQQDPATNREMLARAVRGDLRLLYVAPERFSSPQFVRGIRDARIGLFVVDEAHCVSEWGHDFRPDYFRLGDAARWLGADALLALTATATPQVATDIARRLRLEDPAHVRTGFDRPTLSFAVASCGGAADKRGRLEALLRDPDARPAIVYAGTRKACEATAADLGRALGVEAIAYHAGLPREDRAAAQRRFMDGEVDVVVATNAFGMGVDKADVRTVVHTSVPQSVEAYYQEAGRAGRDGRPARAVLLAENRDKALHVHFIKRAEVDDRAFAAVAGALARAAQGDRYDVPLRALGALCGGEDDAARAVVGHLHRAGVLKPAPAAPDRVVGRLVGACDAAAVARCRTAAAEAQRIRWRQYRSVWALVEGDTCRRRVILEHFGDPAAPAPLVPCCDVCDPSLVPAPASGGGGGRAAARRTGGSGRAAAGAGSAGGPAAGAPEDLEAAIVDLVGTARPPVGRTRAVEVLRGGRSQVVVKHAYDGLPAYGAFAHLSAGEVLARVDALLEAGRLRSSGGRFPKLELA